MRGTSAAWLVGTALVVSWAASWASDDRWDAGRTVAATGQVVEAEPVSESAAVPEPSRAMASEVDRLMSRAWMPAAVDPLLARDPFAFDTARPRAGHSLSSIAVPSLDDVGVSTRPHDVVVEMPALAAIAVVNGKTIAVISLGGTLHYVSRGDVIAGRYRVDTIDDAAVDVLDLMSGTRSRLTLQHP